MLKNSLWKWCTVAMIAVVVLGWGSQAYQSAWTTKIVAEGPDASRQRVITPDIAVVGSNVYISYVEDAAKTVWLVKGDRKVEVVKASGRVMNTTVAASESLVCVDWQQDDFGIYQRCANAADLAWLSDPVLVSAQGVVAGQHDLQGEWSGGFDNAMAKDGTAYMVWGENYDTLKAAKSTDGKTWAACGDIPNQPGDAVRYPTIYVDDQGTVWAGTAQANARPEIFVWMSTNGCADWKGPNNTSNNAGFSDAPGLARLGDKLYETNDDDTTNPNDADIHVNICAITGDGASGCETKVVLKGGGFPHIATDGKGLYVTSDNHAGGAYYGYSCDAGANWAQDDIPNSRPNTYGVRDPDFGITIARSRIAAADGKVYVAWATRQEGKSRIMLSTRAADCK